MSKYEFDGEKVKKLYGAMQKLGYQQSLGEFEKGFYGKDNYQKRKAVYDVMTENGADLGSSYEDFIGRMRATSATKPTNKAPNTHISEQPWAQKSKEAKRAAAVLDGGFDALTRAVEVSSDENFRKIVPNKLASERVEDSKSKRLVTKPKKYSVPESDVREGGSMVRMVDAYKTVDGKAVPIPTTATSAQPSGNQDEDFATQYISGKINRDEYKKKANAKDSEAAIANSQPTMESDEEFLYRTDKRYREYRDKILNGDGDVDELSPETKVWYLQRVEARIKDAEERQKKYLSIINSDEHQKKLEENNTDFWRNFSQARGGVGAIGREQAKSMLRETDYTEDMDLANAGLGATESELTDLHALRDMLKGKDVGFFRRFKDFFGNRNNLTFGYQDFADNATLIANKNSKNPLMSSAAESKAKESEAATMYSRSANLRAKAGSVTAEMLPFVIEMASAGSMTSVAGKAAHKAVYSLGTRMLKSAALKGMEEGLLKATGTAALKVGTRGLSWIAHGLTAGALQIVTAGAGETAANITGRMVGQGAKQEDGSYAFEGGEGAVGAVLHGFTSQLIENATEFMGGGLGYGVGKVASKLTKPLAKVGLGGVTDFFGRIAASPISKATSKTLSKFQIQGIPEEIGEEYLGWAGHSMAGDGDAEWSDFADFQKHKELWATMALSVGAMGAFAASGHIPSLLKRRGRSLKMADRAAAGAFSDEEKWNALRDKLDGTDNNNVLRSLYDNVMQDKSLNGRERKAAMLYAGNLLAYRGANLGAIAGKRLALEQKRSDAEDARRAAMVEGAAPDDVERIDEHELDGDDVVSSAFRQGYEETSAANAYLWAKTLEEQEGHAMESLGLSEKELNEKFSPQNAGETLNEMRKAPEGAYTEEQKKTAFDYANTRAAYEGVVERTQDDIDSEIAYHHAIVDRQTNVDFGRLHPVKLFTSEKNKRDDAFLVSGRLAFEYNDKGEPVVSTRLSDPTLIVSDAAGRTRMVSPSEFADAEDAIDVDEYKNTLAEHIRQEMEERKYAEMLKAAEEAQANEVEEGEAEAPAVEGESTSEEEKETPKVNEDGEQSNVFGGSFNVGDKFSTEDGEFEVVQLTEGEAPIVQNVETGQQFRPHSEADLRAAVQSYTPAFIDGAENTNGVTTYSRVAQEETAPQNEAQEDSRQEEVAPKPNEAQQEEETTSENESVDEEQEGLTEDSDSSPSDSQSESTQEEPTSSLEEVQSALDKGEIVGVTPQMAHDALYNDPDLETEEVDAIVENSRSASQANLAKLQKTEIKPRKNESVIAFKKRKAAHAGALAHAEELVRFWEDVQEHRRNLGAQAMQEAEAAKAKQEAEAAERAKEQAENGLAVAPSWANAEKIVGRPGEFITPNGLRVKGHYVLVESGAAVPSHDARHGFKQSEGFPTDEKGHTLNDRDYERDLDAQRVQREIARNYDARATQQPVVVSPEGFVLSGNGRTMSGDLAAMENTDGAYNSYVREYAEMWGFTSDQVEKLEHPRVVFVSDSPLPLTTETFAAFNAQETKTQSRTEKAVKMGKAVSDEDFAKILRVVTDGHETLADFYGNMSGVSEVINLLESSGVITQQDRANLFDGDALSDEGRNLLENVLLGKAFESNPDVVRQLSEVRSLRTSVLNALFYIVENERLNEEFRLGDELSRAINFVYHARKGGGYSFGDKVRTFAQLTELFESTTDVTLDDATVLLLADALNDKRTTLIKSIFKSYNERAEDAGRGQMSLFGDALPSRETLIIETLALLGVDIKDYAPSNQVEPSNQATNEQQQEPKQQQQPEARTSESTSEQGAEGKTETELPSGSVSTSGRRNEGVSTEEEGAKPSDKNAKPSEKSTEKGKANKGKKKQTSPSSKKPTRVLVSEEQHLKNQARLKELLRGTTLNVGINPEILALGIQEAAYYLEGGIRTFVDFASKMVEAFGDDVRPYVKAFYNGARDMPELAELGIDKEMTPYDEVREFDVGNFDRETNVEDKSKGTTESNVVLNDESPKEKKKNKQEETTAETNSENKENEEQSDLFSQSNLGEEKQEPKSSSLEVGQKVKYRTSSGNLRDAEVKALNYDGTIHVLVDLPLGAIPTINVPNAKMSDIVVDEPTQQEKTQQEKTQQQKKEKQSTKTNKKNGQRNKSTHGSVGTEAREDTRPTQRGRVDRSDSGDNVPDGSGSTRISSVPRENGQRGTTDVKPESSDKETETDKKEDKKESKNLNSRSFHQTVAEAEAVADENNTPAKRYRANIAAIKLIHQLEEEGRLENATPEEQKILASYSSWGGLGVYFGNSAQSKVDELREVLTDEEFEDAVSSLSSGYFTPPHIVKGMWDVLRHLGFKGGRVFEGSAGVGGMLTLMPSDMLKNSSIRAVEKDSLTAKILKALHPDADVFSGGIEDVNAAPSSVDVAITNVPFVSGVRPVDKRNTDLTRLNLDLHDFAIAKNVRLLAPGGIGIFMTTSLSLDKGQKLKEWLNTNGEADVLGAFRFNNETFAGAPVTTDVIVIRKRDKGKVSPHAVRVLDNHVERVVSYVDEKTREEKPLQVSYNNYFYEHPEFMGGRMFAGAEKGDTFRPSSIGLYPDPNIDQKLQWEKWVATFESMDKPLESVIPSEEEDLEESSLPVGTLTVNSQGQLGVVDSFSKIRPIEDDGKKVKSKYTKAELLEDYNRVKEAVRAVLDYQLNNLEDDGLKPVLEELNKAYDSFVNKYGAFHKNQAIRVLKNDADYQGIAALERVKEHRNEKTRKIEAQVSKSDFFTQRTLGGLEELKASTIEDGLRLSMSKENRVDAEFIAGLLNREISDVEKELLDKELVYRNPTTGLLEDKASYLSGNVREKLSVAESLNTDGQYAKNINALTSALPPTIPIHLISTPLGGTWFSPNYFRNFLAEKYGSRVVFYRAGSQWHMDGIVSPPHAMGGVRSDLLRRKGTSRTKYHWTVEELTLAAMNNVAPKAQATIRIDYDTSIKISDEDTSRVIIARMADLKDEFQSWMSKKMQEDPKAAAELEKSYNERFNSHIPYRADNSLIPEHFEGSNPAITLRSHQAAAAVRSVNSPTLLAHEVGTGKTFTMITAAAEMKRLGTANKPMIVVQNATLNQFASEAKKLYPAAKLLVYDANRDKGTDGRKAFYARIKYGDWDMIVVPQSVLDLIPDDPQQKDAYLNQAVDDMLALAEQTEDRNVKREIEKQIESLLRRQSTSSSGNGKNNSQRSLKDQEVAKEKAEDKAERRMMRHTDEVAHFGEMGVDALIVDEAHEYKHLGFATTMTRVKGIDPSASKKAVSLYLKTRHILENNGWKNVVFATGTPVSNTAAEVWTFMRYLVQPETLKQLQLYYFDDFVHNFGKIEQRLEFSTNGQFKEQTRFAGYQGLPELARAWASIADTVLAKDTDIKRPKRDNEQGEDADQDIFLEQTPSLVRIMKAVKAKLEEFEKMSGAEKKKNSHIPLTMFGLASAAAIDTRLVSSNAIDEPGSKTNAAVERTLQSLEETKKERGTVAIFADKFRRFDTTEDGKRVVGFNLFEDIREKLIARGVPAEQIVVMQDGMTDKAKADIFAKVNAGEIRVIMGSTQRLGVGVNIQERLNLLIHMDAPARPMDYTQRNGRILRQGNLYEEWGKPVHVVRFGVKDSLDVSAYQRLQTKEGFIRPIMESQRTMDNAMTQRSVEEDEGEFDNPVAQLSGSQYALLLQKAKREVRKYEAYEAQWKQDQTFIPQQLRKNAGLAKNAQIALTSAEARLEMLRSIVPQGKVQDVALHLKDGSVAHNEDAIKLANSAINAIAKEIRAEQTSNERTLSLSFTLDNVKVEIRASLMGIQKFDEKTKTISTSVSTSLQWSSEDLGVKDEPLLVHRLGDALNYITESVISGAEAEEQIERAKGQLERLEKENASLHERQGVSFKYADELKRARGLATDFEQKMHEELKEQEARYAERMNKNGDFVVDDLEVDEMIMSQIAEQEAEEQEEGKAREQRTANENALDGVSPEQIELRDGLVDIMREAGMDVSVSDAEGQRVLDLARGATIEADAVREAREIERVNAVFNDELDAFSEDNANRIIFSLGRPSEVLRAAGVPDMPMKLYGSKLLKKIKKHGFDKVALRDLPRAVANPIAVFNNHKQEGNRAILTELHTEQGNVLVAIDLGKGADVDFNVVSSVFGKGKNGVVEWINKRQFTYVDEEKALNYLHLAAPIAAASDNQKLSLAANIIKGFKNPKLSGENLRQQRKKSITEEMQSIKTKAQSDGTFMLAPNSEPTNLTERQWLQVRTEAFKEWFGDWENDPESASKVVDENGEPRVVYHQTSEQFTKFDLSMSRVQSDVQGFFFSSGTEDWSAMGDEKMAVFLNLRNPVDKPIVDQSKNYAGVVARENLLKAGNDGAISFDEDESEEIEYLVLSPSQIKSATDNVGAFDKGNDDIRFYRGQHGEVRGFAVGGRIYLDPKMASDETAIHEYTHLWADALRRVNPAEWENVKGLLRDTPIWEETKRLYPELADDEDALADEVLAQFSGKHGAKRLAEAREKAMSEADGVFDKAKVASVFDNVRQALKRFWKGVADFLGLHFTSAEEVADKVLSDLLNGVNPNDVIANTKDSIREQRIDKDTREEMQRSVDELRVEVREGYEKAVKNWKYKIKEQWQDSMLALKTFQDELEKKGAKIEEWENAYWAENRMSSMNEEEMKAYTRDYFKPIVAAQIAASKALPQDLTDKLNAMDAHLREFEKMNAEEKQRNAVDNYLMLKHGLERNHVLAMRDAIDAQWENPSEASSVWRAYNEDAGNRENRRLLQEGKRSFEEFLQVDDAIRAHYAGEEYLKNREKDYSGLTSMTTEELTELKDVENAALQLVKEAEDAAGAELSALWDKVNKATRESVEKLYKSGLLTSAAYSQMTTMFQWYVPLRGFAEETSDEVYDYVDQRNGNGMGAILRGADGRKSKADSPIAHIGSMAERSIVQGNRNLMKQHFYRMVMAHPNDLVSMGEIYLHHNEVTDEWEMMTPTHSPNATPEQIAEETRAFEERMQELVQQEPDNYLRLREHSDVPYRVLGSNLGEHQVLVKVLGRDKLLTVNGDPRVAQAVNGRFNPDAAQSLAGKSVRALNRVLAQMATQSNPEFIFRNMFRDRSYAMKASLVKDGARYWQRLERNWVAGLGQVIGLSKRYENGTLNINNELDKMFQEFMMNGGATGVTRLLNPEDYKGEITDIAKELQRGKYSVVKLTKLMKKYIEFFGSCSELITRFATYRTSREMGRSVARAVWDAKEISTNFNKKGAGNKALRKNDGLLVRTSGELASFFRNYVIFTNANIQGFHNQWQIAKKHPLRFALNFAVRGLFTGFLMTLANRLLVSAFGDDDDRYMDLPESARRSNLCFFVPGLGWVKFPLGFNYRSFYGLGGLMAERVFMPDESYESFMKSARSLVLDMLPISIRDSKQPLWLNLVPSGVRPMAEVAVNEDWSGRPIVNEYINEHWPEYRRANNHTSPVSVEISKKSSDWTGGDEYSPGFVNLNPSQFEHIALGLLSGVGTLMGNTYETTANLIQGEELDPRHIPFLRDFLARNNQPIHASAVKHNFYALKDEYEKTKVRVLGYEKEEADGKNDSESVARRVDFRKNSKEYKRYEVMDGAVRTENKIRKYMKEATTPEEVKKLEADLQQVMEDAINDVRAIK